MSNCHPADAVYGQTYSCHLPYTGFPVLAQVLIALAILFIGAGVWLLTREDPVEQEALARAREKHVL